MLAAVGGAPLSRPSIWQLTKLGVKDGMKAGLKTGALKFGTHLYEETYPLTGLKVRALPSHGERKGSSCANGHNRRFLDSI